jgi:hypothetical protein
MQLHPHMNESGGNIMNNKIQAYGIELKSRPRIKTVKSLDLTGEMGKQIVKSETKLVLKTHKNTFQKLAFI